MRYEQRAVRHLLSLSSLRRAKPVWLLALLCAGVACEDPQGAAPPSPVRVAIVDSGVARIGLLAPVLDPRDRVSVLSDEGPDDRDGHGTRLAALVHLHAPGAALVAIKVIGPGGHLTDENLATGVRRAVELRARVVLLAMSGAAPLASTRAAIAEAGRAGVFVVVAAGNDGLDLDAYPAYPAVYVEPNMITVAATDGTGRLLRTSNRSRSAVLASGLSIATCDWDGTLATIGGTSAASALVAAHVAELLATKRFTPRELREQLAGDEIRSASPRPIRCQ